MGKKLNIFPNRTKFSIFHDLCVTRGVSQEGEG